MSNNNTSAEALAQQATLDLAKKTLKLAQKSVVELQAGQLVEFYKITPESLKAACKTTHLDEGQVNTIVSNFETEKNNISNETKVQLESLIKRVRPDGVTPEDIGTLNTIDETSKEQRLEAAAARTAKLQQELIGTKNTVVPAVASKSPDQENTANRMAKLDESAKQSAEYQITLSTETAGKTTKQIQTENTTEFADSQKELDSYKKTVSNEDIKKIDALKSRYTEFSKTVDNQIAASGENMDNAKNTRLALIKLRAEKNAFSKAGIDTFLGIEEVKTIKPSEEVKTPVAAPISADQANTQTQMAKVAKEKEASKNATDVIKKMSLSDLTKDNKAKYESAVKSLTADFNKETDMVKRGAIGNKISSYEDAFKLRNIPKADKLENERAFARALLELEARK